MNGYTDIFRRIERITPQLSDWTPIEKAHTLAALVLALRPALTVEVGVWQGASLLPMALAHRAIGHGRVIAVDPWAATASVQGQVNADDVRWWSEVDHEQAYQKFVTVLAEESVSQFVEVVRATSDEFAVPEGIGLAHIDGNHGDQAVKDVQRFAPKMATGGVLVLDDYLWAGGGVRKACAALESAGWTEMYRLGTGGVWRRR
jgi:predicted O-methyltransferase YrrM